MKQKNKFFRAYIKRFSLGLFVFAFFVFLPTSSVFAAATKDSLMNAFKSYVTVLTTPVNNQVVTTTPPPAPLLDQGGERGPNPVSIPVTPPPPSSSSGQEIVYVTPQPTINEATLLSALRNLLSKKEIANKLRGSQGAQGIQGLQGPQGASVTPAPNPISYLPVHISYPNPSVNFSGGASANIANLSSNILTATTSNITTLNVAGTSTLAGTLNVTGAVTLPSSGSLTSPLVIGSTSANGTLTLEGNNTTGNTATNANLIFKVGNNAATTAMTILNNGNVGVGTTTPGRFVDLFYTEPGATRAYNYLRLTANSAVGAHHGTSVIEGFYKDSGNGNSFTHSQIALEGTSVGNGAVNSIGEILFLTKSDTGSASALPTEKMRVTSDGKLLIGTNRNGTEDGDLSFYGISNRLISIGSNPSTNVEGKDLTIRAGNPYPSSTNLTGGTLNLSGGKSSGTGTSQIQFQTATAGSTGNSVVTPTTKMTILGSGNVGIGTTSPGLPLQVVGHVNEFIADFLYSSSGSGVAVGGGVNGTTAWVASDYLGATEPKLHLATWSNRANANGITIDTSGNVGIGTTNPSIGSWGKALTILNNGLNTTAAALEIASFGLTAGDGESALSFVNGVDLGNRWEVGRIQAIRGATDNGSGHIALSTRVSATGGGLAEVMRLTDDGKVGIGDTTPDYKLDIETDVASYVANFFNDGNLATRSGILIQGGLDDHTAAGPSTLIGFQDGDGGAVGSITFGSSATAYNTTSDQRLKNLVNENTTSSLNILNQIKIHDFTWKEDANHNLYTGIFAQELYDVYPHAITKPINDADNWMVDYSKLTPVMIASIQELDLNLNSIAGTITPLAGSANESFVNAFFANIFSKVDNWMADRANGIGDFFADKVHTKQICVAKADGTEFCADGDQLQAMAGGSGTPPAPTPTPAPVPAPSSDTTPPVITLTGESTITLNVGDTYTEQGATATDNVDTGVAVIISGSVDTSVAGTYTITYNATDTAGNNAIEVARSVVVQ